MRDLPTLAKALASDELKIRKRAQIEVEKVLCQESRNDSALPTYAEMLAICKGLHYTLWMQDKLLLKEEVVRRICHILPLIPQPTTRLHYINAMFETLAREWDRLDNWRVDKFMLLLRDFFTQGLHSLVSVDRENWDHILQAIFEKILNTDVQHAIGLKMHMCTVLAEELSKKRIKAYCVQLALVHLVSLLVELPKHHAYTHNILRVIHTLLGTLRRYSTPNTTQLTEKLNALIAQRGKHFKSVRRIAAIVRAVTEKAEKLKTKSRTPESTNSELRSMLYNNSLQQSNSSTDSCNPSNNQHPAAPDRSSKKRKKKMKKGKIADKKRRLTENSTESIVDVSISVNSDSNPLHEQLGSEIGVADGSGAPSVLAEGNSEDLDPRRANGNYDGAINITPSPPIAANNLPTDTLSKLLTLPNTPADSVEKAKRRVSFGKVFRKRFIASQRLSLTPTVKTTPKKGILRDQARSATQPRLSL